MSCVDFGGPHHSDDTAVTYTPPRREDHLIYANEHVNDDDANQAGHVTTHNTMSVLSTVQQYAEIRRRRHS